MRPISVPTLLLALAAVPAASATPAPHYEDAALRAVQFVDDREGWAVGDEGAVWHTIDGGRHWERQPSGVRASLRSVHFLSPYVGWVAGREDLPGGASVGVVLYTTDGGLKWRRLLVGSLPALHVVRFTDDKTGYLAGDGSPQFPSGVFATTDGGRSWQPVPGPRTAGWRGADFTAEGGALVGAWNRLATVRRGRLFGVDMDTLGGRSLFGLQLRGQGGFAVGQGGLVLRSDGSRGGSWDFVKLPLPAEALAHWDFHAVGGVGGHVWAVGRPGSVALHSSDGGKTWRAVRTGQTMPLHGVHFRDEKRGWMVGELGTILHTADGGATWQAQQRGGRRLAVLCVHARRTGAPLDTVALLGGEDGYLTAGLCLTGPEPATADLGRGGEGCRFAAAFRHAGGAVAETSWQFPVGSHLRQAGRDHLVAAWDRLHGDRAGEQLLRQVVLAIRAYRPDVVLTDDAASGAAEALVAEAVREAFARAGDPGQFAEQLTALGLEAHNPGKLYAISFKEEGAPVRLDLTTVRSRLGTTPREAGAAAAALLDGATPPTQRFYRLLAANVEGAAGHRQLMQGVRLAPGGEARRPLAAVELSAELVQAARRRANLWAIAEAPPSELTSPERLLAQIGPSLADMPQDAAARVVHGLAGLYAKKGQWGLARETYLLLAERYPTHPLAVHAFRWLLMHQASSEARRRHEVGQFVVVGKSWFEPGPAQKPVQLRKGGLVEKASGGPERKVGEVPSSRQESSRSLAYLGGNEEVRRWYQGAVALDRKLAAFGPLYATDPATQFCVQAARRQLGDREGMLKWCREFAAAQPDGPWRQAALAELWLATRQGPPPRPTLLCRPAAERPFLDGKLDDACWQEAKSTRLSGPAGSPYPTEVRLTHDREFLYVAVRCGHPVGGGAQPATPRTRDADLRGSDRVSVLLDLDRDYATCFHFQVDARGCVAEDCWGDRTWNPKWFVAVHREATAWTVEAAIPKAALTGNHVTVGSAWAANVVRVLPGQGVLALSQPAEAPDVAPRPEGLGLLLFVAEDRQRAETRQER